MKSKPITFTLQNVREWLPIVARWVDEYGPEFQPWLDRLEREYARLSNPETQQDRIRRLLAGDLNASGPPMPSNDR